MTYDRNVIQISDIGPGREPLILRDHVEVMALVNELCEAMHRAWPYEPKPFEELYR